ncbi:lysophospholipid acyltransferase family protein [Pseudomonas sp. F1_0610]|uniref:lysophospholipid acyltransferase family protein n=1 Tax=Pseudomonas sp. F1_0610 TaxID=3114284 RepID=UPI0039C1942F
MVILKALRFAYRVLTLTLVLLLAMIMLLNIKLLSLLGKKSLTAYKQQCTQRFMQLLCFVLPVHIKQTGKLPNLPMLWVSNHISWLDVMVIGQLQPLSFLSKAEVRNWPVFGWLAQGSGTLFIQRGQGQQNQITTQIAEYLDKGYSLVLFPEGTSTDGQSVKKFYSRLLAASIETMVPVQPVALTYIREGKRDTITPYVGDDVFANHLLAVLWNDSFTVNIQLLKPIGVQCRTRTEASNLAYEGIRKAVAEQWLQYDPVETVAPDCQKAS